jgi:hypothetical protein
MNDSMKFTAQLLLTLALGVVMAVLATYFIGLIAHGLGKYDPDQWPMTGNLISGTVFGLVVGYRIKTLDALLRKQKK